jgi:hypothetical protein
MNEFLSSPVIQKELQRIETEAKAFTIISALCTAGALAYPVFALPAITYWIGAAHDFLQVPSMNPPGKS